MSLYSDYPWVNQTKPLVVSAPMMKISLGHYALATSAAGGLGFLAGGFDLTPLEKDLAEAAKLLGSGRYSNLKLYDGMLPIGVGVQNWGADLNLMLSALKAFPVAAAWFFAPKRLDDLTTWTSAIRAQSPKTKIWIQVGCVFDAMNIAKATKPDVIVVQGSDAGGHGLAQRAGVITLLPEVSDALAREGLDVPLIAAGGIIDGRGAAAVLCLGAQGVCLGTRLLASEEAIVAKGYQNEVLRASDGGINTVNSTVYDSVRGIKGWPAGYHGRGVINQSYTDAQKGMSEQENQERYQEEIKKGDSGWGPNGRMTTYAGTGVGLIKGVSSIRDIVDEIQRDISSTLEATSQKWLAPGSTLLV